MIPRHLVIAIAVMVVISLGMGVYVWHMRGHFDRGSSMILNTQPVAAPVSGPTESVNLYVAYDNAGVLRIRPARIPLPAGRQERAEELLRSLLDVYLGKSSPHALGSGSEVRDVYLVEPGLAVVDVNSAFADGHRSGVLTEELTVASLLETIFTNVPGVEQIRILVDGKERDTLAGHVDLTTAYDAAGISKLAGQLLSAQ